MAYLLRTSETGKGLLVAACDADVLGQTLDDGDVSLEVTEAFYGGDEASLDAIVDALERCFTANLVGNDLLDALQARGVVAADEVARIDGVAHSQLVRI